MFEVEGLTVTVLDGQAIRTAGMGALAAVAAGSVQEARLIRLEYAGAGAAGPPLAMVGKAVTFDSGGLSLKQAAKMYETDHDGLPPTPSWTFALYHYVLDRQGLERRL